MAQSDPRQRTRLGFGDGHVVARQPDCFAWWARPGGNHHRGAGDHEMTPLHADVVRAVEQESVCGRRHARGEHQLHQPQLLGVLHPHSPVGRVANAQPAQLAAVHAHPVDDVGGLASLDGNKPRDARTVPAVAALRSCLRMKQKKQKNEMMLWQEHLR